MGPWVGLQWVIVVFPDNNHIMIYGGKYITFAIMVILMPMHIIVPYCKS